MEVMNPGYVVPIVAVLVHPSCQESGSIFEAGAGHFSKIRWERSRGFIARPDENLTAELVLRHHSEIMDFTNAEHPTEVADSMALLEKAMAQPRSIAGDQLNFRGRVVLVTGAGEGLGRAYAKHFASLGAKVVVNDIKYAEEVAEQIRSAKGEATALTMSVEEGEAVVRSVLDTYGRIDVVVNNAGILGDKAFQNMTEAQWFSVYNVHLRSTYKITKAAWPYFLKQKYGRVVNITSTSGIYGNFGQANYAAAVSLTEIGMPIVLPIFPTVDTINSLFRNVVLWASRRQSLVKAPNTASLSTPLPRPQVQT